MFDNVVHGFLSDAIEGYVDIRRELAVTLHGCLNRSTRSTCGSLAELTQ